MKCPRCQSELRIESVSVPRSMGVKERVACACGVVGPWVVFPKRHEAWEAYKAERARIHSGNEMRHNRPVRLGVKPAKR